MDTIFAQATAAGKAGISVIRVSGPGALSSVTAFGVRMDPVDRKVARLLDIDGALIDKAFLLSFEAGHSFTGEPIVEFHTHGSRVIVSRVLNQLLEAGFRPAEPGEFTRRALETGQLDLSQVEGLADLIDAETEEQRRQAVRVFDGALGRLVDGWHAKLVRAAALLEATIDFADEDVPENVFPEVQQLLVSVNDELAREAESADVRERVRDGFEVAIVGAPNTGKSTLLNRLAGRDAAITSEHAGTTRDVIEVRMDLKGLPVAILDTAGVREAEDDVERIGIDVGRKRASGADLRIYLLGSADEMVNPLSSDDIVLLAKADCHGDLSMPAVSGRTGAGTYDLVDRVATILSNRVRSTGTATRARHAAALRDGADRIGEVLERLTSDDIDTVDLLAEDVRAAIRALDTLVGRVDVETLLDEIFNSFCIGK